MDSDSASIGRDERRSLARGASLSFVGTTISASLGFLLIFAIARLLGEHGSGVVIQVIGAFSIVTALGKLGLDSAALWLVPRYLLDRPRDLTSVAFFAIGVAVIAGVLCAIGVFIAAGHLVTHDNKEFVEALLAVSWALPLGTSLLVALAIVRALGAVTPFVVLGSITLPALRLALIMGVAALGLGALGVAQAWAAALLPVLFLLLLVARRRLNSHGDRHSLRMWLRSGEPRNILSFALPRSMSALLEQGLVWVDVLIVGALAGTAAAGVYGSASRFIAVGLVVDAAIRVIVSPRFSALLHEGKLAYVQALYRTATRWLVLFASPGFLGLLVFAPVVLGWLGPDFVVGATALMILACGAMVTFLAGNIHSLLLMSGYAQWAAFNKAVALVVLLLGCLWLVPLWGAAGAAVAWTAAVLSDAAMAMVQVRRLIGIRPEIGVAASSLALAMITVFLPSLVIRHVFGLTTPALIIAAGVSVSCLLAACYFLRVRLELAEVSPKR